MKRRLDLIYKMNTGTKYIILLFVVLTFGCSLPKTQVINNESSRLPGNHADMTVNDKAEFSDPNAEADLVNAVEITDNNCGDVDCFTLTDSQIDEKSGSIVEENIEDEEFTDLDDKEREQNLLDTALDLINASQNFWSEGNLEKAVQRLDQAYALVLKVDTESYPELIQQKEDIRFMISKRILEIYA